MVIEAPLAGIRVLDTATLYAAPLIATLLADHGAEVVKVEPPDGDECRRWQPLFTLVGRGKRSVTLDVSVPEGRQLLMRLVAEADVVIENQPRRVAEHRGLTPDALRAVKASLVVVSVSGFGRDGPYADRPANGTIAEAFSGLTGLTGEPDGAPQLPSAPIGDALVATFGALGALAGIVRALRTGIGATVDVTMYEPLLHALGTTLANWRPGSEPPHRDHGAMGVALRGTFRAADGGWLAISASTLRHERAVGDLAAGFAGATVRERAQLWIAATPRAVVLSGLAVAKVPCAPVNDLGEMSADPQVAHRESLQSLGDITIARPTPVIDGPVRAPTVPELGEANREVLGGWLGLSSAELNALEERGII